VPRSHIRAARQSLAKTHGFALFVLLFATLATHSVRAQSAEVWQPASPATERARVLLVREGDAQRGTFALRVERALNRALSELGLVVSQSPLPFRDAQLAAGCAGNVRECGGQVALALESEQLVVSAIEDEPSARYASLTLYRFASHMPVRAGTGQLPREPARELELTVYALVESLFADRAQERTLPASAAKTADAPEPLAQASAAPAAFSASNSAQAEPAELARRRTVLRAIGWPSLVLGAGLLVGGAVMGASVRRESEAYNGLSADTRDEVDTKIAHADEAQGQVKPARVLCGVGGGLAAAGIFVLLWERLAPPADRKLQKSAATRTRDLSALRISAAPALRGFSLTVGGKL
jgi:hypothetical protein